MIQYYGEHVLKNISLIDIIILVSGFLLRTLFDAEIIGGEISGGFYLTIMAGVSFFALGKRRNELEVKKETREV